MTENMKALLRKTMQRAPYHHRERTTSMTKHKFIAVAALTAIVMNGCAPVQWSKPGATTQNFYRDRARCSAMANAATPFSRATGPVYGLAANLAAASDDLGNTAIFIQTYRDCMQGEGWTPSS